MSEPAPAELAAPVEVEDAAAGSLVPAEAPAGDVPRREPAWLLVVGLVVFAAALVMQWWPDSASTIAWRARPTLIRATLRLCRPLAVIPVEAGTPWQFTADADRRAARSNAAAWERNSRDAARASDRGRLAMNAAVLYAMAGDLPQARSMVELAQARDREHADVYARFIPLFEDKPRPVDIAADDVRLFGSTEVRPLLQAWGAALLSGKAGAHAALQPALDAEQRLFRVQHGLAAYDLVRVVVEVLVVLVCWVWVCLRWPTLRPGLRRPMATVPWGPGVALLACAGYLLLLVAASRGVRTLFDLLPESATPWERPAEIAVEAAIVVVMLGAVLATHGRRFFAWRLAGWQWSWHAVGAGVVGAFVASFYCGMLDSWLSPYLPTSGGSSTTAAMTFAPSLWRVVAIVFTGVVMAPFAEETFDRGLLLPALAARVGIWPALLLAGLVFASLHGDLGRMPGLTLHGAILAFLYWRTGSLWAPAVAHMLWNTEADAYAVLYGWAVHGAYLW